MFQGYLCGCFKINPPEKLMLCYAFLSISKDLLGHPNVQTNLQYVHIHIIYIYISIFIRIYGNICIYRLYFLVNLHHIYIYISWKLLICDISTWRQDIFLSWAPFFFRRPRSRSRLQDVEKSTNPGGFPPLEFDTFERSLPQMIFYESVGLVCMYIYILILKWIMDIHTYRYIYIYSYIYIYTCIE